MMFIHWLVVRIFFAGFLLSIISSPAIAEIDPKNEPIYLNIGRDIASPVITPAWHYLLGGSLVTLTLVAFKDQWVDPLQKHVDRTRPLGKYAKYGDKPGKLYPNVFYTVGMYGYGLISGSQKAKGRAISMLFASAYAVSLTALLKETIHEPRPNTGLDKQSFPSGHATAAFAFAGSIAAHHEWYWAILPYAMASFVATARMNENKHYLHDVVAGATIGISYGWGMYYRMLSKGKLEDSSNSTTSINTMLLPADSLDGLQLLVKGTF